MDKLITPIFRVGFPNVFEPRGYQNQEPKYSIVMLFDKEEIKADPIQTKLFADMKAAIKEAAQEKWSGKVSTYKSPFRKGEEKPDLDGYGPGIVFLTASSKSRPGLVNFDMTRIMSAEDFYAGCYARATVNTFAWDNIGGKGISFGLQNLQKVREGNPFSGRTEPEADFDALEVPDTGEGSVESEVDKDLFGD